MNNDKGKRGGGGGGGGRGRRGEWRTHRFESGKEFCVEERKVDKSVLVCCIPAIKPHLQSDA